MALSSITQGFGVVTVINALCVPIDALTEATTGITDGKDFNTYCKGKTATQIADAVEGFAYNSTTGALQNGAVYIDTLKIANLSMDGPSKTITGGQYANPLIKFGKTATCTMQDALGHADALGLLAGVTVDSSSKNMHVTSKFGKPVCIIGDTFVIDRVTGDQVPVREIIYQFLPDSIINLTQEAEGDATVFDLNGSLLATDIKDATDATKTLYGAFYSFIDPKGTNVIPGEEEGSN